MKSTNSSNILKKKSYILYMHVPVFTRHKHAHTRHPNNNKQLIKTTWVLSFGDIILRYTPLSGSRGISFTAAQL